MPELQAEKQIKKGEGIMGCGCACSSQSLTDEQKKVLEAVDKCNGPCGTKDIAALTGLDTKDISKGITNLKKQGYVDSPVRCKYGITETGRKALKK
jgi:predicted transcriptional regulator